MSEQFDVAKYVPKLGEAPEQKEVPLVLKNNAEQNERQEVAKQRTNYVEKLSKDVDEARAEEILTHDLEEAEASDEKGIVETLKEEGESFAKKFNAAKGMEKMTVVIDAISGIADRISDTLIQMGAPALRQIAALAERFGFLQPPWIDWLRQLAASERAVLQEFLTDKNYALVQSDRRADKNALNTLTNMYKAWKEAKKAAAAPPVAAPAPGAAAPATPAPVQPEPTFENYLREVIDPLLVNIANGEKDVEGRTKITLTQIIELLPKA